MKYRPLDPAHQAELDALEAKFQKLADAGVQSVLTPRQAARWQHKVASSLDLSPPRSKLVLFDERNKFDRV